MSLPDEYMASPGRLKQIDAETAYEQMKAVINICNNSRSSIVDEYTIPSVLLNICRAIRRSAWDLVLEDLTLEERQYAADHCQLSLECCERLKRDIG
jgi:hypothetical protein